MSSFSTKTEAPDLLLVQRSPAEDPGSCQPHHQLVSLVSPDLPEEAVGQPQEVQRQISSPGVDSGEVVNNCLGLVSQQATVSQEI